MNKDEVIDLKQIELVQQLQNFNPLLQNDFDDFTFLAADACMTPFAFVSIISDSQLKIFSSFGVKVSITDVPFDLCICQHTVNQTGVFVVNDIKNDSRFQNNPLLQGYADISAYAGVVLYSISGQAIGTLSVIDTQVRDFTEKQLFALKVLGRQVQRLIELNSQVFNFKNVNSRLSYKKAALENISEGVSLVDEDLKIVEMNSALIKILDMTASELIGRSSIDPTWKTIKEDLSEFPRDQHPSIVALKSGQPQKNVIMGIYKPNKQIVWLKINATPIFLKSQPNARHVVINLVDITEEKNASAELIKQKETFKRVLNCMPSLVGFWSNDLRNISANSAYTKYFQKEPSEIQGMHIKDLLGENLFLKNLPYIQKVLSGESQRFERRLNYFDGSIRDTVTTYTPEFENGQVSGFLVIVNDITEQKQLEADRRNMEAKLVESSRLSTLGEMASGIAHEINTPLAIIQGKVQLIKRKIELDSLNPTTALIELKKIEDTVLRIATIVKGLRSFSRDAKEDPFITQNINSIINETLNLCSEKFKNEDINLIVEQSDEFFVNCRPSEISQVLMNLLSNSYDSIKELNDKWIKIAIHSYDDRIKIEVIDSGLGIRKDITKKIMQPFFTTKEVGKGTGLGLSISKGLIESHKGQLYYDENSFNTCFVVDLPIAKKVAISDVA